MLYANTDDGSSAIWVLNGDGVVIDNISYPKGERAPILEQINEHYGTSFTGWSDNEIGLRIGDTLPDWNAYEKIEMPFMLQAILMLYNPKGIAIKVANGIGSILCYKEGSPALCDNSKMYVSSGPPFNSAVDEAKQYIENNYGVEINEWLQDVQNLTVNQLIPNSEDYQVLT